MIGSSYIFWSYNLKRFGIFQVINNRFKKILTIQIEIMLAIVLISASTAALVGFFYQHNLKTIFKEKTENFSKQTAEQVGDRIDFELAQLDRIMEILISYAITSTITQDNNIIKNEFLLMKQSERMITNIKHTDSSLSGIFMLGVNNIMYSATGGTNKSRLFNEPWIKEMFSRETEKRIISTHNADYMYINLPDYQFPVVSIVQKINRYNKEDAGIDIIQLDLKYSYFEELFKVLNRKEKSTIFIIDENGKIIYHPDFNLVGHYLTDTKYGFNRNKDVLSVSHPLKRVPWNIIGMVSTTDILRQYAYIKRTSFGIVVLSILAAVFTSFYLSKRITKPLESIVSKMRDVSKGNFSKFTIPTNNMDLQILIQGFDKMVGKINVLMEEMVKQETEIVTTELNALKSQINSHFLYNSLEVIRGIALDNNVKSIAEISHALAKLFRYSINKSNDLVPLEQEFDIIKGYVKIHEYRYVDRFNVQYNIEEKILGYRIVRFIIQPIIENAIQHGIERMTEGGVIIISAFRKDNTIIVKVQDNGAGMDTLQLKKINEALKANKHKYEGMVSSGTGVGILNVNSRIKLYYGDQYGVKLKSKIKEGTSVELIIPVIV